MKKKICVVTSSRSEYGILKNLILLIKRSKSFQLEIIVTGAHLSKSFGNTIDEIIDDRIIVKHKINIDLNKKKRDNSESIINQSSILVKGVYKKLTFIKPDLLLLLGDRFEIFVTAYASLLMNIPIAHIHGGEITTGSIDNVFRFAISKMSNLHFVATKKSKARLIKNDMNKKKVYIVGSPSISDLKNVKFHSKEYLEKILQFTFQKKNILVTLHPTTKEKIDYKNQIRILLRSLKSFKDIGIIFTQPSNDIGSKYFISQVKKFVKNNKNCIFVNSLGRESYLSCLKNIDVVVGNSSSGIIEAPSLGCKSLNIGNRQSGREQAESVINSSYDCNEIITKLKVSINKNKKKKYLNPYFFKNTNFKILTILKKYFSSKI